MTLIVEAVGKRELEKLGIAVPRGILVDSPEGAFEAASVLLNAADGNKGIGDSGAASSSVTGASRYGATGPAPSKVVVKAQVRTTGRAGKGLVAFADSAEDAAHAAREMLGRTVSGFPVAQVLVEEFLDIEREFFAGIVTDTRAASPLVIFASRGGAGIEEIAREHPECVAKQQVEVTHGLRGFEARNLVKSAGIAGRDIPALGVFLESLYRAYRSLDARSLEVNPLVVTKAGNVIAADCHLVVDDYAVFRHPELGVEIARELGHPPTPLERIAYACEKDDYRGTFYFIQLAADVAPGEGWLGFHGSGGGGSMMSMDALADHGFRAADFCDTSGNPPASKVYRAARIILSQPGIDGYFLSGSGVASQEQHNGARGLIKAFRELKIAIPAVIRLGGNKEELAIEYLHRFCADLPVKVEAYGKDDPVTFCAGRMKALIAEQRERLAGESDAGGEARSEVDAKREFEARLAAVAPLHNPDPPVEPYAFKTLTGNITFDHAKCVACKSKACIEACTPAILSLGDSGRPRLNISEADAARGKCTECLACEAECWYAGKNAIGIDLPIAGL